MDTFMYAFRAIFPILLLMALGYAVRRMGSWSGDFFKQLNKLCFRLFLPVQLFCSVASIEDLAAVNGLLLLFQVAGILVSLLLGILTAKVFIRDPRQKGVTAQASFRSNQAILGLPLSEALGGEAALAYTSLSTSVSVPIFNVLAVLVLSWYGDGERPGIKQLLRRVVTNPLIISCLAGLLPVLIHQFMPAFRLETALPSVWKMLQMLSKVASPVMLFVLGTNLNFGATGKLLPQLSLGVFLRLILCPLVVIGSAVLLRQPLGLTAVEMPTMIAVFASPIAVSSVVMTQELGGDDQLAAQEVVWSSVLSMLTIFLWVFFLRTIGLL